MKRKLRDEIDRAVQMADRQQGVYSVDPHARPVSRGVETGAPAQADKVTVIPAATFDPIRSEGNWAPFRPVPEPIPGMVPGFNPGGIPQLAYAQWGATGTPLTSGFLTDLGEYNPEVYGRSAVQTYEKMRRGDAQVWATLSALKSPLRSARWDVRPGVGPNEPGYQKAKEVADFVKENLFGGLEFTTSTGGRTTQSWDEVLWNALLFLDFGCSVHENVFHVDGQYLKLRAMVPLLPITYYRWHTEQDGHTLIALEQYGYRGIEFVNATVPAEKLCRFTLHQEGSNFWGIALNRSMYPHWYIKSQLYRIDAVASERNGIGVPVITLPQGASPQDQQTAYNFVTKLSAHEMTGLVLPHDAAFSIEGVKGQPRDIQKSIEHHNRMISTAAMAMFMTIGSAPHGSRSTAATQHDFFLSSTHFLSNYISERLSQTTIKKLVEYNFGEGAIIPKIRAMNLKMRDFEDVRESLQELAVAGLVVSDLPLRNLIRDEYELPAETEEGVLIQKKGESIEDEPGGKDIATPTDVPDAGGKAQPKQPPAQIGKKSPMQQPNQKQYGKPIKPVKVAKEKKPVDNVIQSSEVSAHKPTIYFVRHGETADDVNPEDEIVSSWTDVPLTQKGLAEAKQAASMLKGKNVAEMYASDLARTLQTASVISQAIGVPVTEESGLRGWNVGAYKGLPAGTELQNGKTIGEQLSWLEDHPSVKAPQGESWNQTSARLHDCLTQLLRRAEQLTQSIVVVTHSRVISKLGDLTRGLIEGDGEAELGHVSKATRGDDGWSIEYNATKLSDAGYDSSVLPVRGNRSGQPTQRDESQKPNPQPAADEEEEEHPAKVSPVVAQRSNKTKKVKDVGPQQAEQGAKIIHGGTFKPSASQEVKVAPVPEIVQPADKQDTPLEPTPDPQERPTETFDDDNIADVVSEPGELMPKPVVMTERKPKVTHWESVHGPEAVQALRAQHNAAFQKLLAHVTGPLKAKIVGAISRQASQQLKSKVPASQMQFTMPPHLESAIAEELNKIHLQAHGQAKSEVKPK